MEISGEQRKGIGSVKAHVAQRNLVPQHSGSSIK